MQGQGTEAASKPQADFPRRDRSHCQDAEITPRRTRSSVKRSTPATASDSMTYEGEKNVKEWATGHAGYKGEDRRRG